MPKKKDAAIIGVVLLLAVALFAVSKMMPKTDLSTKTADVTLAPDAVEYLDETPAPEATAEPEQAALTDETQTEDGMTQVYMLHGQITEITDEYLMLEGTEQGTVQVNLLDDTLYDGAIQQSELAVGQYAEVLYDGKLTRSIPAQAAALAVNIYPLAGTVDEVQEDGRVLVTPTDGGAQVLLSLPDDVTVEVGETATFYTTGVATMSLPAQMNAIGVVK